MPLFILAIYTILFVLLLCFVFFSVMKVKEIRQRIKKDLVLWVIMSLLLGFGIFYLLILFWLSFPRRLILLILREPTCGANGKPTERQRFLNTVRSGKRPMGSK